MRARIGVIAVAVVSIVIGTHSLNPRQLYNEMYPVETLKRHAFNICDDPTFIRAVGADREACYNKMPNIIAVALGRVLPGGALSVAALLDPSRQAELLMTLAAMPPQQPITVPRSFANTDWTRGLAQPCDDKNSAPQAGAAAPVGLPPAPGTSRAAALDNVVLGNLPPMPRSSRAAIGRQPALPVIPLTAAAPPSARVSGVDTGIGASFKPMPAPDIGDPDSPVIVPLAPASACRA